MFLGSCNAKWELINTNNSEMCCKHCNKLQLLTKLLFFKHTCKRHFLGLAVPLHYTLMHSHYVVIGDTRLHLPTHTTFLFQRCWCKKMCACRGGGHHHIAPAFKAKVLYCANPQEFVRRKWSHPMDILPLL